MEFLTEIANNKLVAYSDSSGNVVNCYGISQDPTTKNYIMVMEYMEEGNLRQFLQKKKHEAWELSLEEKLDLALKVCDKEEPLRPNIDKVPLPQLLKDLIKRCWDADSQNRPSAEELRKIIKGWWSEIWDKKNTEISQQYQEIAEQYNTFSKNTPYQIHPTATTTSKMIDTDKINKSLELY